MSSESIYQTHKPSSGSGDYLKIKDGQKVKLRFASEPAVVTYDGIKIRYQWVVYNRNEKKAQIYEAGAQVFGQLAALYEDWGSPDTFDVTVSRTGSGQFDTSYTVTPSPKSVDLTDGELEAVAAVKFPGNKSKWLRELEEDGQMPETIQTNKQNTNQDEVAPMPDDQDAPIDLDNIPF